MNPPTTTNPVPVLELRQAAARHRQEPEVMVATGIDWTVQAGEFWVIAGEQSAGTRDFLFVAAGLLPPADGTCRLFGTDTRASESDRLADRLRTGFVFEDDQLFPELSLLDNIALPLFYHRDLAPETCAATLAPLLERMELTPIAHQRPDQLSRNWRKRASLARALALTPELLFLDNPFHGLGAVHRQWWTRFLDDLARERKLTVVLATEDLRPWAGNPRRQYALLHEGRFQPGGTWPEFSREHARLLQTLHAAAAPAPAETEP